MRDLNRVLMSGYLGQTPRLSYGEGNKALVRVSLGSHRAVRQLDGSYRDVTEWLQLVLWNRQAEAASSQLSKGDRILVEGRLQSREYQDWAGNRRNVTELVVQRFYLLTPRRTAEPLRFAASDADPNEQAETVADAESESGEFEFDSDLDADELADMLVAIGR
jgi:single-strand DNA-binding protein